jgi:serine/threonine-protein kinase PRP4
MVTVEAGTSMIEAGTAGTGRKASAFQPCRKQVRCLGMLMSWIVRIEPSPPKSTSQFPPIPPTQPSLSSQKSPRGASRAEVSSRSRFQSINVPTGPRSSVPSRSPVANGKLLDPTSVSRPHEEPSATDEPVVVLEQENDPQKLIEERRRKREEIMAKFKANGRKASVGEASPATPAGELFGTGAESVTSAGTRTGGRTGAISTTGEPPFCVLETDLLTL